jgi:hypothetical protein
MGYPKSKSQDKMTLQTDIDQALTGHDTKPNKANRKKCLGQKTTNKIKAFSIGYLDIFGLC